MMKKILIYLLLFFIATPFLFAQSWGSNLLGQKISEETDGYEYILTEEGEYLNLFKDNVQVSRSSEITDSNVHIITVEDFEKGTVTQKYYTDGLLTRITETTDNRVCDYIFVYRDLNLLYTSYLEDSESIWIEYYLRNASDNSLIGVNRFSTTTLYGSSYILTEDRLYLNATEKMLVDTEFSVSETGNIVYTKEGITFTYSPYGLLLSEETAEEKILYFYNENSVMTEKHTIKGSTKIVSKYKENILVSDEEYSNNELLCITYYNIEDYVMKKRVYSDGKPLADVWYKDNRTQAERIEYLN